MGDGGVACMPLQHIMERLSIPEACCGGNNGNGFNSNSLKLGDSEPKKMKKVKKVIKKVVRKEVKKVQVVKEGVKKEELEKAEFGKSTEEIENGEICNDKIVKEEVEEGELGTLKWPKGEVENGEFEPEKPRRSDSEKGEIVAEKSRKGEVEKGEFRFRKGDGEKADFGSWRGSKDELEKGEFIPDRWQRDVGRDGYGCSKMRRHELAKDKGWKFEYDHERERTPPSGKNVRISSKIVDDEGTYKTEHNSSKNHGRELVSRTRMKRYGTDSDGSERKHHGEYGDHMGSKIRKLSDDSNRTVHLEHYSRRSMERSYRNSSSSRISSSDRFSSRHYESSFSSKVVHDRHGRSPVHSERSPRDRARYHDHRDRSPAYRSSPRRDRSPYDRSRHYDHRNRSPAPTERSPQDRPRYHERRDRTPTYLERSPLDHSRPNNYREASCKGGAGEKRHGQYGNKVQEEKLNQRDANGRDPHFSAKESQDRSSLHTVNGHGSDEKSANHQPHKEEKPQSPCVNLEEPPQITVAPEELASMEEDMDIFLVSDHLIKHVDKAPGNLLAEAGDATESSKLLDEETPATLLQSMSCNNDSSTASEPLEDLQIDERVRALLKGFTVIPGRELETLGEVLQVSFEHAQWEKLGAEGLSWHQPRIGEQFDQRTDEFSRYPEITSKEASDSRSSTSSDKDYAFAFGDFSDWFSARWASKGGDWKRNDESAQDRLSRKKLVLNDGYPLCQMPKSGYEDPRWHRKDELYYPSHGRKLDLPIWAFSWPDERSDSNSASRASQIKPVVRGVKGSMLPVVRINACVSEPPAKVRGKDRYSSRSARAYSSTTDVKRSSAESASHSKSVSENDSQGSWKCITSINTPKDRLCTAEDLQLHLGDWYYLDGAGHEQGPSSFSELQALVDQGSIQKHSSVFRKNDKIWNNVTSTDYHCTAYILNSLVIPKEMANSAVSNSSLHDLNKFRTSGIRGRWLVDGSEDDYEMEEDVLLVQKDESTFEDLCSDATFYQEDIALAEMGSENWGLLDGNVLARVFHFLRTDVKSLAFAALTCKHWRAAVRFYKGVSRQVDLSSVGSLCTDSTIWSMINGYNKERITSMILIGCTNITPGMLEDVLGSFPSLSSIDIRGCSQFWELADKFSNLNWIKSRIRVMKVFEESYSKIKALKQITERPSVSKPLKGMGSHVDDSSELKEYFDSVDRRESASQSFRRSYYKRSKLFDARRSSSILSRDARMRRWSIKNSENGYKRMEEFLASSLRDIMKENTFDFFVPKVAEIEDRMKNGYYAGHGLSSVKEDISRMCRDAIKAKNRGDSGNMNRIITLFIRLATCLEEGSKSSNGREEMVRRWKDESPSGLCSSGSKYKKKLNKIVTERKHRSNGGSDYGEYASDREIRRRLSKLNKKSMDSGSDTSDDLDRSSEGGSSGSESTASDTESDLDFRSEGGVAESRVDGYFTADEGLYSMTDDREWGARMTKVSLVPPVTRKYEVIEQYVIVADEDEVQRKMKVSLPEHYNEKLTAQKNGTEESDMEIPEVKDYKPRKQLGDEVIEQEVYGIDPYTHNLLLDSMPEELDWPLLEKHLFIEEVLLCTLNKQVRHFTGTGNTPMMYHLQPVVEDIQKTAEEELDLRTLKMCQGILKAMNSRPDDNYVAYRKGLGVVCNKEGGFSQEDFVVEFLGEVYPAWKWFEKQDGIRSLQKNSKDPAPEFYNIYLERPKGDADGYDLVVVDAMHKANYASRICHSCRPNCEAKVTAVEGQYQIGIYTVRQIQYGEEITFDYNSVTESKEEYEASVCLCGSQVCRGSYLNLTGEGAFQKVLKECHGILDRYQMMFEACELNMVSEEDYIDLGRAGLGSCLLGGLPDWLIAYAARLVRFINFERTKLPEEILRHSLDEKRKYFADISLEVEKSDAELQAEGVYNQRLQNLALTLDKVRYVMRCVFGDPKKAPPPLERLSAEEVVSFLWNGEGSLVEELLQCMAPHMEDGMLSELKPKIRAHDPSGSDDIHKELQKSLLWLRDEVRNLPCNYKCRHDAAADLIHIYAYTKCFFRVREYKSVTSPPVYISPLDLGPKYSDKLGSGIQEYCKTYGENYCLGQLIYWHNQTNADPDCNLARASRGCLSLPDIGSFYAKVQKPSRQRVYGPRTLRFMLARMEKQPQRQWPKDRIWSFKSCPKIFGSPMLDAVLHNSPLDREMLHWLKNRPATFQAMWDR
ncbi:unnamed protein product, partial [Vitis vinifera]